jgi:hypothetical protein
MKQIVITYSNGDREISNLNENYNQMLQGIIDSDFKSAWHSKDAEGNFTLITNMEHVRSIEIVDED